MTELLLQARTRRAVEAFMAAPSHGLILQGKNGAGKKTLAHAIVDKIIQGSPYTLTVSPAGNSISIEEIRRLQEFVRLKTTGTAPWRRAITVVDAHRLTAEAQNAFLKLLEEPPADTLIVLTADTSKTLLPTIRSRAQTIAVNPVTFDEALTYFQAKGHTLAEVRPAYYMSGGQVGLLNRLLSGQDNQELLEAVQTAKQLLGQTGFERLAHVDRLLKQKVAIEDVLWGLLAVSQAALHQAAAQSKDVAVVRWQRSIQAILEAQDGLAAHPLPKLLLTNLCLQM